MTHADRIARLEIMNCHTDGYVICLTINGREVRISADKLHPTMLAVQTGDDSWLTESKNDIVRSIIQMGKK